ncbi:MAG TPA: hypothetical protein VI643_04500 [Planctomycetota bacterium]|nr:hypothetical protein [Planctomycetota bacterium]
MRTIAALVGSLAAVLSAAAQDPIEKGKITWSTNHDAALEQGKKEERIVIVYFWAPW